MKLKNNGVKVSEGNELIWLVFEVKPISGTSMSTPKLKARMNYIAKEETKFKNLKERMNYSPTKYVCSHMHDNASSFTIVIR